MAPFFEDAMPWLQRNSVNERVRFVAARQDGLYSMVELCTRFGISRETGYKWLRRYAAEGPGALEDKSHAPHRCPHRMEATVEQALLQLRREHPRWGPRKLLAILGRTRPDRQLPAPSTVGDLFSRHGLVRPRRTRLKSPHPGAGKLETSGSNEVWTADYKGEFKTRDGSYCFPLTVMDSHTRYLLGCDALLSTSTDEARACFDRLFREYGLPRAIRTDNGVPFSSPSPLRLSRLGVWLIKLGIRRDLIRPASPQENGRHERMHRDLDETRFPPGADQRAQQVRFDAFREEFVRVRPHEALGMKTPASVYVQSRRRMPDLMPSPEYEGHCEVRQVHRKGLIRFRGNDHFLSEVLAGEQVALEEVRDGIWSVYLYDVLIARYDEREQKIRVCPAVSAINPV